MRLISIRKLDKKSFYYLGIVLAAALFVFVGLLYYIFLIQPTTTIDEEALIKLKRQKMIEQQLQGLNEVRGEVKPLTEKEIQSQLKELDKARSSSQPLIKEEIQKQLKELN